jgi:hypothetical protein
VLFRPNTLIREELSAVTFEMDEEETKAPEGGEGEGEDDELA